MKKILFILFALAVAVPAFSQSMKMVVDFNGNIVGRYVRTNTNSYTVEVQDIYDVPKDGNRVVTFSADKGQGVIYNKNFGKVNVRSTPSTQGTIIGQLEYIEGELPICQDCLGKVNGWYKIRVNGKIGYVRQDLMEWDGADTF